MKTLKFKLILFLGFLALPFLSIGQRLTAANVDFGDYMGYSVAVDGNIGIAGAYYDDNISRGANSKAGAAHILRNQAGRWTTTQMLLPNMRESGGWFGHSVAISGNTVIVGEPNNRRDAMDTNNGIKSQSGAAHIFVDNGGNMNLTQKLVAGTRSTSAQFGWAVAISGDLAVISAPKEKVTQPDGSKPSAGVVYVFRRTNGQFSQIARITPPNPVSAMRFGQSVDIDAVTGAIVVGTELEERDANDALPKVEDAGAAYVYITTDMNNGNTWILANKLVAPARNSRHQFGKSVSIDNNTIVIGAPGARNAAGQNIGAFYVYQIQAGSAVAIGGANSLADARAGDLFGQSVSISGNTILVGAPWRDLPKPNTPNRNHSATGASYVYNLAGNAVNLVNTIAPDNYNGGETMGWSVATDGATHFSGAYSETVPHSVTGEDVRGAGAVFIDN